MDIEEIGMKLDKILTKIYGEEKVSESLNEAEDDDISTEETEVKDEEEIVDVNDEDVEVETDEEETEVKTEETEEVSDEDKTLIINILSGILSGYMQSVDDMQVLLDNLQNDGVMAEVITEIKDDTSRMVGKLQAVIGHDDKEADIAKEAREETEAKLEGEEEVKEEETEEKGEVEMIRPLEDEEVEVKEEEKEEEVKESLGESLNEELKITISLSDYEPWSGAVDTYNKILDEIGIDRMEAILEDIFPDGCTDTQLNDFFWFEDNIYDLFGMKDPDAEAETHEITFNGLDKDGDYEFEDEGGGYAWIYPSEIEKYGDDFDAIKDDLADQFDYDVDEMEFSFTIEDIKGAKPKEEVEESITEDTVKQGSYWVNKGKEGTHGKFKTKKDADAQRKAMFSKGFKESAMKEDLAYGDLVQIQDKWEEWKQQTKDNSAGSAWRFIIHNYADCDDDECDEIFSYISALESDDNIDEAKSRKCHKVTENYNCDDISADEI